MTIRLEPNSRTGQATLNGRDSVHDNYGTDLLEQAIADGTDAGLQRKLENVLGI